MIGHRASFLSNVASVLQLLNSGNKFQQVLFRFSSLQSLPVLSRAVWSHKINIGSYRTSSKISDTSATIKKKKSFHSVVHTPTEEGARLLMLTIIN